MSISALPPSTARLLGSSSAIADPLSLAKELVDNSIDAGATSIEVTIASNTVDKIQVRDNGRGIRLEDYDYLGRRAHTSKLRSFEELEFKGGTTLGFRGEALASANSLATIKVSTRTAQDPVGSLLFLKFGRGGVEKQQPISSSVGTTVQAWKLFENIPVRKQTALKGSRKTLTNTKKLLEGYALALPHLKLSFKVPGDPCQSWLYSPCSSKNTREAITQVFGHALVTQLDEVSSDTGTDGPPTNSSRDILLTAFLPSRGSDAKIVKSKGAFISVDSRPISSATGTGKKIVAIFKASISRTLASTKDLRSLPNPFMQLSIKCQPGSYDPNVSPLKDEVLFKDEPAILDYFQALCDKVYGGKDSVTTGMTPRREEQRNLRITRQMQREASLPQTTETPRGSRESPTSVNCQSNNQGSNAMNGLDPIETLNNEIERVLDFSSNNSQGGNAAPPVAVRNYRSLSTARSTYRNEAADTEEPQTVSAAMRTKAVVNLSRNDSNSSDAGVTEGLIPVKLARRHAASSRRQESPPIRLSEDIGRYFRPKRHEPIEIATDETATLENMQDEHSLNPNMATGRLEIRRPPLMELTESDLNTAREEEEDEEEEGDDESVIEFPVAEQNATPLRNMAVQATTPRPAAPSPLVNIPFRPLTRPRPAPNPTLRPEEPSALRTPPSSDPARANLVYRGSPSGSPINQGLTRSQRSPRNAARLSTDRFADHGRRRSILDNGQIGSLGRRQVQHGRYGSQLTGRRNTLTLGHDDADAHLKDVLHGSHAHAEDQEGPGTQSSSVFPEIARESEEQQPQGNARWAHTLQTLLMRTPPPPETRLGRQPLGERYEDLSVAPGSDEAEGSTRAAKRRRVLSRTASSQGEEDQDPRRFLMKRQRSCTQGGRLKRLGSKRLPFETIPQDYVTTGLLLKVRVGMSDVSRMISKHVASGRGEQRRRESGMQFKSMDEVEEVDKLLREVVGSWMRERPSVEVEYTLRTGAKGKSRA
ncbi:hypothetical protein CDV31_016317 [Fusarium ambrosium]|uniref:DNA mismatch repair protein S5 domain-containing protein n=1 Tax=Fusarium ambrosium TaxID=131363 RepID=A0A428SBB5_9HYPO|nr:hypothetical protein CDV31_016317 [Fusarium ambrosium]